MGWDLFSILLFILFFGLSVDVYRRLVKLRKVTFRRYDQRTTKDTLLLEKDVCGRSLVWQNEQASNSHIQQYIINIENKQKWLVLKIIKEIESNTVLAIHQYDVKGYLLETKYIDIRKNLLDLEIMDLNFKTEALYIDLYPSDNERLKNEDELKAYKKLSFYYSFSLISLLLPTSYYLLKVLTKADLYLYLNIRTLLLGIGIVLVVAYTNYRFMSYRLTNMSNRRDQSE